jgi:hypothetical protein
MHYLSLCGIVATICNLQNLTQYFDVTSIFHVSFYFVRQGEYGVKVINIVVKMSRGQRRDYDDESITGISDKNKKLI